MKSSFQVYDVVLEHCQSMTIDYEPRLILTGLLHIKNLASQIHRRHFRKHYRLPSAAKRGHWRVVVIPLFTYRTRDGGLKILVHGTTFMSTRFIQW